MTTDDSDTKLLELIANSRLTAYFAAASLCVLLYDHILCLPDEVKLMWGSRWGLAKIVYLWNRYFSLIIISLNASVVVREIETEAACVRHWMKVQGITTTTIIATVDFILMVEYIHLGSILSGCYANDVPRILALYATAPLLVWDELKQLLLVPASVVYSIVASRTLLNIKAIMAEEPVRTDLDSLPLSALGND
ncbi:hypothetical protein C8R45DRAFT_1099580 [Mycena sanguinolenta]|nr:hypothetical protein C8R45DRAFT_1099580 [Mycena sanguinolenta]